MTTYVPTDKSTVEQVLACLREHDLHAPHISFTATTREAVSSLMAAYPDARCVIHTNGWWSLVHENFTALIAPETMSATVKA